MHIEPHILEAANQWLTPVFDDQTQAAVKDMMATSPKLLEEAFYKNLEFGTGGMRGIMGVGTNRINKYTLGKSTQGVADYMKQVFPGRELKVAIAYDCRHNSDTLAGVVAGVFSANGIRVFLFSELRPTPELSFAVKYLGCQAGIVLTASHNPPEDGGFKYNPPNGGPADTDITGAIERAANRYLEDNLNGVKRMSYERARKADVLATGLATDGLQQLFALQAPASRWLRNRGMNGFDLSGPLKHWVARQAMGRL